VSARVVAENHYTELKRTYERTDSGRREMAKDIAAKVASSTGGAGFDGSRRGSQRSCGCRIP
jgi:hypothetical protein